MHVDVDILALFARATAVNSRSKLIEHIFWRTRTQPIRLSLLCAVNNTLQKVIAAFFGVRIRPIRVLVCALTEPSSGLNQSDCSCAQCLDVASTLQKVIEHSLGVRVKTNHICAVNQSVCPCTQCRDKHPAGGDRALRWRALLWQPTRFAN